MRQTDEAFVPDFLRPFQRESIETEEEYVALLRRLSRQPAVVKPILGKLPSLPPLPRKMTRNTVLALRDLDALDKLSETLNNHTLPALPTLEEIKEKHPTVGERFQSAFVRMGPIFKDIAALMLRSKALFSEELQLAIQAAFTKAVEADVQSRLGAQFEFVIVAQKAIDARVNEIRQSLA